MMSSGLTWAGLFGILYGIESGTDVEILGLEKTSQPTAFISKTHRQHERQRLHQAGISLCVCWRGVRSLVTYTATNQSRELKVVLPWGR